jgi:hypothetical protein
MKGPVVASTVGVLLVTSLATASAQSLADVARQEQERRKAIKQPARVYTDADIQKAAPLTTAAARPGREDAAQPAEGDAHAAGHAPPAKSGDSKAEAAPQSEEAFRARFREAQEGVARSRRLLDALEQQAMRAAIAQAAAVRANQPVPADPGSADRMREMERLRAEMDRHQATLNTIGEEARRAGVPPGAVR